MKKLLPHLAVIAVFTGITFAYFYPVLTGKDIKQHDMTQVTGMAKELVEHEKKTGKQSLWTNSMFGGMPAYQIWGGSKADIFIYMNRVMKLGIPDKSAAIVFWCMLGFYILMMTLGFDIYLSCLGAIAFAFCSYNFIIIEAGHVTKGYAIAYMPLVISGILLTYNNRFLLGGIITALGLGLEVYSNHLQITYYLFFTILILLLTLFIAAIREKQILSFLKASLVTLCAAVIAVLPNITTLWTTYEYGKYTTRSQSELNEKKVSTGLDKDYALAWSMGVSESMTLLIPNFMGGASGGELGKNSETYKALKEKGGVSDGQAKQYIKSMPLYWGEQPFTSGPPYIGAIVCFLFVLGLFIVKGPYKWWLLSATLLFIVLSWGKNFSLITDLFFDYIPGYNKFRTVAMALTITQLTMPLLALLAVKEIAEKKYTLPEIKKYLLYSLYITGGITLFFTLLPGAFFDFTASADEEMKKSGYPDWLIDSIRLDRESLLRTDAFRSLIFILLSASAVWLYLLNKIKRQQLAVGLILLALIDMWSVNKRYLNADNFVSKKKVENPFVPTQADLAILQDTSLDFRVYNSSLSTFNDASTSYFHKSIGGYHGAKLKRYQELIEYQIGKGNMNVFNMLNTKYFIRSDEQTKEPVAMQNPGALGNVWFVREYKLVANADSEMNALTDFNPAQTAIIDKRFSSFLNNFSIQADSVAVIKLSAYQPDYLIYESSAVTEQLAVFSEIHYEKGWNAFIDGKPASYFRTNYVLRAMKIPAGKHKIEFRFEPESFYTGEKIAYIGDGLLILLILSGIFIELKKVKT